MPPMSSEPPSTSFARIDRWLAAHAPRTRAALLPAPDHAALEALAARFLCELPEAIVRLYGLAGGQSSQAPSALFRGYFWMPLDGVDGLAAAWDRMLDAVEAGAPWASKDRYPFAKDFGGSCLCIDTSAGGGAPGRVVCIEDGECSVIADDVESFLAQLAADLEAGRLTIDDAVEERERFEIVFDAARAREPGDAVTHSVLSDLAVDAHVEPASDPSGHGFQVRMVPRRGDVVVGEVRLEDDRRRRFGRCGHGSGGGQPGFFVFLSSKRPIPPRSRLYVVLERVRRV